MKWLDLGTKSAFALPPENEIHRDRVERWQPPLHYLPSHSALVGKLLPQKLHRVGAARNEIDRVGDRLADLIVKAAGAQHYVVRGVFHPVENPVQHRQVELLLRGKMMEQRRRLDSDAPCDIAQAGAAIAVIRKQRQRDLEYPVARVDPAVERNDFGRAGIF